VKQKTAPAPNQISLSNQLHQLLRVLWSGKLAVVTPYSLQASVWKFVPKFNNYQQQDAQEFLVYLLERLHEELTQIPNSPFKTLSAPSSIITDIFQGKLQSSVKCLDCGNTSVTYESFQDLMLNIPVVSFSRYIRTRSASNSSILSCSLDECFQTFINTENIESWTCVHCKGKRSAEKQYLIQKLPNVLCLVLKRFYWTESTRAKINTRVIFPLKNLNISPYCTSDVDSNTIFDLQSVVIHHGAGFQSGHYTSFCFNRETDTWFHFNDNNVDVASEEEVKSGSGAYILFYEKRINAKRVLNFNDDDKEEENLDTMEES
jgi:ubiquitin C-terminal hydrolase